MINKLLSQQCSKNSNYQDRHDKQDKNYSLLSCPSCSSCQKLFICVCLCLFLVQATLMGTEITTIGTVYPSSKSMISTQVSGRVQNILIDVGSEVKKDQPLLQIDNRTYKIELAQKAALLEKAKIEMSDAEKDFSRMQKLWEKPEGETPSISLKRYEDAKTKYLQTVTQVNQAQETLNRAEWDLGETTIKAPYDGIITRKQVDIGESITADVTDIVEIQSLQPLYLEFCIPQTYLAHLHLGSPISFDVEGVLLNSHSAQINLIYPSLDENTHSLRCRAILDNKDLKIPAGSLAKVKIKLEERE